ncbi:MAG TPA: hypothetical protein PKA28_11465 [Methylomusa anaerophila]|uniref:Uncharacterized protein n=1 Tax=Methylomusa anaerophila TaxID=1930071 RepID=A0A348AJC7_9FIRM|nr:hypothetical protein [Methylomusa anaerophila]BBB91175.1 hypothetical protein MAMMFC1_01846 [Methylomusa anaerophila]HML89052.1 hypothetical protein [Methylomusa anaerophila]
MRRATFIRILTAIKLVSNNVSVVENFNNKALVTIRVREITGESAKQFRSFRKVLSYCSYFNVKAEDGGLAVTLEFEWL